MHDLEFMESVREDTLHAGSRTYFFDVKKTKADDYFLVITERKKSSEGKPTKKQKVFIYKEHFGAFREMLQEFMDFIYKEKGEEVLR